MDVQALSAAAKYLHIPHHLSSRPSIDNYAEYLQTFSTKLIDQTVPTAPQLHRSEKRPPCRWWTPEVERLVKAARRAERQRQPHEHIRQLHKEKKRAIYMAKRADWRQATHEAQDSPQGIWKLVNWAKTRSHLPAALPTVPPLRCDNTRIASSFQAKPETFHRQFFPLCQTST